MDLFQQFADYFLHLDVHLNALAGSLGPWLYLVLFLIIFCETGLVVTPVLPGDSLLFAVGALASSVDSPIRLPLLLGLLIIAAITGDALNYYLGSRIGPRVFSSERSRLFNKNHLRRAQEFYEKYGSKTIVLARFIPIIRTFAPFVAGIGKMEYRRFAIYNIFGGVLWVGSFLMGGYLFGESELVKKNFHIVIGAILVISVLPAVIEVLLTSRRNRGGPPSQTHEPEPVGAEAQ